MILLIQPAAWNQLEKVNYATVITKFIVKIIRLVRLTALKIHITTEMNDELAKIGGFKTEHRGLIDVKVSF